MNITIKHAGRKATIIEQSNGIPVCKLHDNNGNFLRSRTLPDMTHAIDFCMEWLYSMEKNESKEYVAMLQLWHVGNKTATK